MANTVSGNSIASKSFQSLTVSEALLSKTVEAIKAGEKEARSTGIPQSFEAMYRGFRQNIAIGKIVVVPPAVADKKGQDFPTALLYGCLVRTFGGEEIGDMISHKIGDTEWDEYSQASYSSIKEELFGTGDGKFAALVLFIPNWVNKREYIGFQFPKDDNELSNLTRHLVFSSYFDPRLSSAFDAMMTDVETSKFDVTDITPKMNFPALAENPLKEYPLLTKEGSKKKARLALTIKTADEVTKEVLEPQEMDVFESLDTALRNSLLPSSTKGVEDASEGKAPTKGEMVPRVSSKQAEYQPKTGQPCSCRPGAQRDNCPQCEGTGQRIDFTAIRNQNGPKKGSATAVFETPITNVGPGTEAHDEANQRTEGYKAEKDTPKAVINSAPIGIALDETGVPRRAEEERKEKSATTKVAHGYIAFYGGRRVEIQADSLYGAKLKAIEMLKVPKSKQGLLAVELAEKDGEQVTTTITSNDKTAKRMNFTSMADVERFAAQEGDLSASASAAWEGARKGGKEGKEALEKHADKMKEYAASMSQDNQAHHAVADHKKEIAAGKHGPTPLSISSSEKDKGTDPQAVADHIKKNVSQARQGQDALKDHHASIDPKMGAIADYQADAYIEWGGQYDHRRCTLDEYNGVFEWTDWNASNELDLGRQVGECISVEEAKSKLEQIVFHIGEPASLIEFPEGVVKKGHTASFDAAKWGGLGRKQASALWVGSSKKMAAQFDEFTRGYIETALWSSNDESDESGGQPLDQNYDIRDLAPSCLQAMTEDCAKFQAENAELLAAASEQDGQDGFRQGHDFWLTRCGHGAGYWDGDYPTTGDGLTEASKAWGNVDIYVGDDDMIYQYGAETPSSRGYGQKGGPVQASKKASKKTASQDDASYIASLIGGGFGGEEYDARSQHSRTAAQKREDEMTRKYSSQRKKFADVPQDIDDIWSETMEDMGPAPEIRLPGESNDNEKSTTGEHEIEAPEMSADSKSDVPEQVKGDQEEPTVKVEEALENDTTKSEEDKPSTGEGGASADSKETKSEGRAKSEWSKNRSKSKSEEPKEDEEEEPKEEEEEEPKEAKTAARPIRQRVSCDQCEMLSINGVACHETGCPNMGARWDADQQGWVKQRKCFECGSTVDADSPCCTEHPDFDNDNGYDENDEHFAGLDAILADENDENAAVMDGMEEAQRTAPAVFYECGACGGVHPSLTTSEKLGLGWNGDCRDKNGHFEERDFMAFTSDDTVFISLEEQMSPNFDDTILASGEAKTADYAEGDLETYFDEGKTADYAEDDFASYFGEGKKEGKTAGRSITPKYVIRIPGSTDAAWDVKGYGQQRGAGTPNDANLARYMEALLKSMEPGGHNEHLIGHFDPTEAAIYPNDGTYKTPLATWSKPESTIDMSDEDFRTPHIGADVSGDFSEAKSEVENPDTVDAGIKQPTVSVEKAAKKKNAETTRRKAADISGDISEAKSNTESPDGVDRDIKQPTVSVPEAARKHAKVGFTFNGQHREASFSDLTQAGQFIAAATAKFGKLAGDWTVSAADDAEDQPADSKKPAKAENKPADADAEKADAKPDETKGKNKPAETPDVKTPAAAPAATPAPAAPAAAVPAAPAPAAVAAPAGAGGNGTSETSGNETSTETGGSSPGGASTGGVGSGMGGAGTGGAGTGGAATSTGTGGAGTGGTVSIAPTSTNSAGGDEAAGGEGSEGGGQGGANPKTPTIIIYNGGTGGASTVDTDSGSGPGGDGPGSDGTGGSGEGSGGGGGGGGGRGTPRNPEEAADAVSPGVDSDNRQQGNLPEPQGNQSKGKPLATKPEGQPKDKAKPELRGDPPVKPQPPHEDAADDNDSDPDVVDVREGDKEAATEQEYWDKEAAAGFEVPEPYRRNADGKIACAGYGDEEDEERPMDLGAADLADLVVEKEDVN